MLARVREPVAVLLAKGKSHMGKAEIERRRAEELDVPLAETIEAPAYLSGKREREEFAYWAEKLVALGIFTDLDVDTLARYILSKALYLQYTQTLPKIIKSGDTKEAGRVQRLQDVAFKQCRQCASDLGLTVTSRCRLAVPQVEDEEDYEL